MQNNTCRTKSSTKEYDEGAPTPSRSPGDRWGRSEVARGLREWDAARDAGLGEREAAVDAGAHRSTVRRWDARRDHQDVPPAVAQFFESPEGVECLSRIVLAVQFVVGLLSPGGIRLVCHFLRMSGLDAFVASSVGSVQKTMVELEESVLRFGKEQRTALASKMSPKTITVCQDETFHPEVCLVAIEPVSDFILVEQYADDRKAETWTTVMTEGLKDLPVTVAQGTSDEAKAILSHVENAFQAHHSPDLFHVQHEASRATALPLAQRVQQAESGLEHAMLVTEQTLVDQATYASTKHGPGRPPDFSAQMDAAREGEFEARLRIDRAVNDREQAQASVRGIAAVYHPFSIEDGTAQSPDTVAAYLAEQFDALQSIANSASLAEKSRSGIAKARRVSNSMVETIRYVHREIDVRLSALNLTEELRLDVSHRLVPGLYLQAAAGRASTAEEKRRIKALAEDFLKPARAPEHSIHNLPDDRRNELLRHAKGMADLFQRSSSCVEGRNGHLSLHHHGLHRLPPRKLAALTTVHNYFATRADGTTAAERFFGAPHDDLFEYLLTHMPSPPRPGGARLRRVSTETGETL